MNLTKEYIENLKKESEQAIISLVSKYSNDNSKITFILNNLGYLPKNFEGNWLFNYSNHDNHKVRLAAIKNIGKLKLNGELGQLYKLLATENITEIRREIVSSIGRQKDKSSIEVLLKSLKDKDPKVVCQAIRALLVFKKDNKIIRELKKLKNHPNEMIHFIIEKEFFHISSIESELHHTQTFDFLKNVIVHGDVRETLKHIPIESVHLTFTSPPYYNAKDYSIYSSYQEYINFLEVVFKQIHRITKEGRFLLINTSPVIIPRVSRQYASKRYPIPFDLHHYMIKMGWEYIDDIIWVKPEASVKNRIGGFQQHRKPLGYKPNPVTEMIMVYRKKTTKLLDWNIRQYPKDTTEKSKVYNDFESSNIWEISPTYNKNHSAVFPKLLCEKVIKYYSFEGDLVFDPFAGSGTFGKVAKSLNRLFLLTELNREYFDYMKSSIGSNTKGIFDNHKTKFLSLKEFKKMINDSN